MSEEKRLKRGTWVPLVLSLLLVAAVLYPLWKALLVAAVLAGATSPLHARLARRLGDRRGLAAGLIAVGVIFVVIIPLATAAVYGVQEAIAGFNFLKDRILELTDTGFLGITPAELQNWEDRIRSALRVDDLAQQAAGGGTWLASVIATIFSALGRVSFQLAMMLLALYFFLVDGAHLLSWLERGVPLTGRDLRELLVEFRNVSRAVLGSMLAVGAAQAVVMAVGLFIVRVPQPLFFTLLTFLSSFIPGVGTALVSVPVAGVLLVAGHTWKGIFMLLWAGLVAVLDNVLRPVVIRAAGGERLHGGVVFFSLIGGLATFGPMGLLVGPLAATFIVTLVRQSNRPPLALPDGGITSPP